MGQRTIGAEPRGYGEAEGGIGAQLRVNIGEELADDVVAIADDLFEFWRRWWCGEWLTEIGFTGNGADGFRAVPGVIGGVGLADVND